MPQSSGDCWISATYSVFYVQAIVSQLRMLQSSRAYYYYYYYGGTFPVWRASNSTAVKDDSVFRGLSDFHCDFRVWRASNCKARVRCLRRSLKFSLVVCIHLSVGFARTRTGGSTLNMSVCAQHESMQQTFRRSHSSCVFCVKLKAFSSPSDCPLLLTLYWWLHAHTRTRGVGNSVAIARTELAVLMSIHSGCLSRCSSSGRRSTGNRPTVSVAMLRLARTNFRYASYTLSTEITRRTFRCVQEDAWV